MLQALGTQRPSPYLLVAIPERESMVDAAWGRYASLDQVEVGTVMGLGPFQRDHQSVDRHPRESVTLRPCQLGEICYGPELLTQV